MTREIVAAHRRNLRNAIADGCAPAVVERLRAILTAEEAALLRSRQPGAAVTVAEEVAEEESEDN